MPDAFHAFWRVLHEQFLEELLFYISVFLSPNCSIREQINPTAIFTLTLNI